MSSIDLFKPYPNPHEFGCPWHQLTEKFGAPNVKWCEETLCQWITEPANTWSNSAYILVAIYFWWKWKNHAFMPLRYAYLTVGSMGFFSFLYHLSNFYPTQLLDFLGMFLCLFNILLMNMHRLKHYSKARYLTIYWLLNLLLMFTMHVAYLNLIPVQSTVVIIGLVIVGLEAKLQRLGLGAKSYFYYLLTSVTFSIAAIFSTLDISRTWCNPFNHWLQGHAIWHMLTAVMMLFLHLFYNQLWVDKRIKNFDD